MGKSKSSSNGSRNDGRSNGKAAKKNPGRHGHGSSRGPLDEHTKILMGKGLFVRYARVNAEGARTMGKKKDKN